MIALLRGVLIEKHPNQAVVEAGGVGYDVTIPVSTYTHLPEAGAEVRLRIHTHVREDVLALYGFLTQDEKALFEKLIGVSGIGPTLAVKVLSGVTAVDLVNAIRRSEVERLVRIPGVGKKTAAELFAIFGSLDELYANLHRIPLLKLRGAAAVAAKLLAHKDAAYLARRLTGIVCDMPIAATLDDLKRRPQDRSGLDSFFNTHGFGNILRQQVRRIATAA